VTAVQSQVLAQYLAVIRGEKSLAEVGQGLAAVERPRQSSDAEPPPLRQPAKGRHIDIHV
jgi:hypothetical protein